MAGKEALDISKAFAQGLSEVRSTDDEAKKVQQDLAGWIERNLWIQTKDSRIVQLKLNSDQRVFVIWVQKRIENNEPLNAIILKARQLGFSTLIEAILFAITSTHQNKNALIISHEQGSSEKLYRMTELYYDKLDERIKPMKRRRNAKELVFENPKEIERNTNPGLRSKIEVETAQNDQAGRSATFQIVHASEVGFWRDPATVLTGLLQSIPSNLPMGGIILESTANGVGNYLHVEWEKAERGEGRYTPFFFPWFNADEYRTPLKKDEQLELDEEEERISRKFGLGPEQLKWRREKVSEFETIAASTTDPQKIGLTPLELFQQEYPCEPIEAFLTTGRPVFDRQQLKWYKDSRCTEADTVGYLTENRKGRVEVDDNPAGYLKLWEKPVSGEGYIVGADFAEGLGTGDFTSFHVMRQRNMQIVAHWWGHMDAGLAAEQLEMLGYLYNKAFLVPECNNQGLVACIYLKNAAYPRLYMRKTMGKRYDKEREEVGFQTNAASKPVLINHLITEIRDKTLDIPDENTIDECFRYVRNDKGHFGAQPGSNDDRVISLALCVEGHRHAPKMYGRHKPDRQRHLRSRRKQTRGSSYTGY